MIKKLEGAELDAFVKSATPEKLAEYYNAVNDMDRKEINSLIESKSDKKDVEARIQKLEAEKEKQMGELNAKLEQMGLTIKKMSEVETKAVKKNSIKEALKQNIDSLKKLKDGDKRAGFTFKAASDMLLSSHVSGGNVPVEQRIAGLGMIKDRAIRLLDIISRGSASGNLISWVYESNIQGDADVTAEGAAKKQISFDLVVASQSVEKITDYIKVSDEMLDDVDFMETAIRTRLARQLFKKIESRQYASILSVASAFAAGIFALSVDNANEADVLVVAMNQIKIADQNMPDYILMHPSDVTKLKLYKTSSTDRRYVDRLVAIGGEMSLDGVPIIESTLITQGEYLVGSFGLATMYDKGEASFEVGLDGNDFTKNMKTIRGEWRGTTIIEHNDRAAFVKGVFATDKTALETP